MKKDILNFYVLILFLGLAFGSFLLASGTVLALSANYSKGDNSSLTIAEWNNLKTDFLAKSGGADGVMTGDLNLSGNAVLGVANATDPGDAVSKGSIESLVSSSVGGVTFINWGARDCPSGMQELYEGFGFGNSRRDGGGSSDSICLQTGLAASANSGSAGQMFPLVTNPYPELLPAEIPASKFIRCSVCYNPGATCFVKYGDENCEVAGYNSAYQGYMLGALRSFSSHVSSRKRLCVNKVFNSDVVTPSFPSSSDARLYGSRVENNFGQPNYNSGLFVRCTVCCN